MPSDWLTALFSAIDARDTDGFLSYLTDNAAFRFGNSDTLVGKSLIGEYLIHIDLAPLFQTDDQ